MIYRDETTVADASRYLAATAMTLNPVAICNPTNLSEIDKDWKNCAANGYFPNPVFRYNQEELERASLLGDKINQYWHQIRYNCVAQNPVDRAVLAILHNRVVDAMLASEIAAGIHEKQDARTQTALLTAYGRPSGSFIAHCRNSLGNPAAYRDFVKPRFDEAQRKELAEREFKASEIRDMFIAVLDYYGFRPDWECELNPLIKTIDARDKTEDGQSRLLVPHKRKVNGFDMATLIGHEIESHIRGSENSRALMRDLVGDSPFEPLINLLAKADNEQFYEGVAKISDVAIGGNDAAPHPYFTIATDLALNQGKSFGDVANNIYLLKSTGSTTPEKAIASAWIITRRIFRGATDTSKGFAFTKDFGYLAGYDIAKLIPAYLHDYSSLTLSELKLLDDAGVDLMKPKYPRKDAVKDILGA